MTNNRVFKISLIILSLVLTWTQVHAAIINVPADQPTIQAGIDAAKAGDTVLVADGIYRGEGNVNINFGGKQILVKSQNGPKVTIIDSESRANTRGVTINNKETRASVLEGFTIEKGRHQVGAGIFIDNASPTIRNCIITHNRAGTPADYSGKGGGIYTKDSNLLIEDCTISDNIVGSNFSGGVHFEGLWDAIGDRTKPVIVNSTISDNTGSGIYSEGRLTVEIRDCNISNNTGRGINCVANYSMKDINIITNSRIEQNNSGGVEVSENTVLHITESIIRRNTAKSGAGVSCSRTCILNISECIIAENEATKLGGGLNIESGMGSVTISQTTITQNTSVGSGGGIFFNGLPTFARRLTITNSIVWGNKSEGNFDEILASGNQVYIKSSNIGGGLKGLGREADGEKLIYEDNIATNPLFVDFDRGDYRLQEHSPAAGMGPQSTVGGFLSVAPVGKRLVQWAELKRK